MIFAPAAAKGCSAEEPPAWVVEQHVSDAQCVQALLNGRVGDFLLHTTGIEVQPYTIFLRAAGLPENIKHVGVLSREGKVHSGIIKVFDAENKRVVVQWTDTEGQLRAERVRDSDIVTVNPRASIRIERVKVLRSSGALHVEGESRMRFDSIEDLIFFYQNTQPLPLLLGGEQTEQALSKSCQVWGAVRQLSVPAAVRSDLRVPTTMTRAECEAALAADGCETGDFVVRVADAGERSSYAYAISVLGAVRVLHIGVARQRNNLFVNVKHPQMHFATLSDVIEHGMVHRLDGLLLRRAFVPESARLSSFAESGAAHSVEEEEEEEVPSARSSARPDEDAPLPWEVPTTPNPAASSPLAPPARFSWAAVMRPSSMQAEIDDIYGEPAARVF